jgi:hypothetical protein
MGPYVAVFVKGFAEEWEQNMRSLSAGQKLGQKARIIREKENSFYCGSFPFLPLCVFIHFRS